MTVSQIEIRDFLNGVNERNQRILAEPLFALEQVICDPKIPSRTVISTLGYIARVDNSGMAADDKSEFINAITRRITERIA